METTGKLLYLTPLAIVIEGEPEGVICASGGTEDYNVQPGQNW